MEQVTKDREKRAQSDERTPIFCPETHKLLARRDERGLYLWCRGCHCEHFIGEEQVISARR